MTRIRLVQHDQDATRTAYRIMADDLIVGTAVELAGDRIAPWRLTIRNCCANLRYSSRLVVEQAVARFAVERPDAFLPLPAGPVAWVPALPDFDGIAADLRARNVLVIRQPMPDLPASPAQPAAVLMANRGGD